MAVIDDRERPGTTKNPADAAIRMEFARKLAVQEPHLPINGILARVRERFGLGVDNAPLGDMVAEVRGTPRAAHYKRSRPPRGMGKRPPRRSGPPDGRGTTSKDKAIREDYARTLIGPGVTVPEVHAALRKKFGRGVDAGDLRPLVAAGGGEFKPRKKRKGKPGRKSRALPAAPEQALVNRAIALSHTEKVVEPTVLQNGMSQVVADLVRQMEVNYMTEFSLNLIKGTWAATQSRSWSGKLPGHEEDEK